MAGTLLAINSLLPSQSLFNEIQSVHETGFFHELDTLFKDNTAAIPAQVSKRDACILFLHVCTLHGTYPSCMQKYELASWSKAYALIISHSLPTINLAVCK